MCFTHQIVPKHEEKELIKTLGLVDCIPKDDEYLLKISEKQQEVIVLLVKNNTNYIIEKYTCYLYEKNWISQKYVSNEILHDECSNKVCDIEEIYDNNKVTCYLCEYKID